MLAAVAILSKIVGGGLPARLFGMNRMESISVGLGMAARMEVAMIIALFGLTAKIINTSVYSVIVIMGVITVLIAPTLLRRTMSGLTRFENNGGNGDEPCALPPGDG